MLCINFIGIPFRIVLTSMDLLYLSKKNELEHIYWSKQAYEVVEEAKERFDLNNVHILPVANYVDEMRPVITKDVLALDALDNVFQQALSFIEDNVD